MKIAVSAVYFETTGREAAQPRSRRRGLLSIQIRPPSSKLQMMALAIYSVCPTRLDIYEYAGRLCIVCQGLHTRITLQHRFTLHKPLSRPPKPLPPG
jgi:hypothetical protein